MVCFRFLPTIKLLQKTHLMNILYILLIIITFHVLSDVFNLEKYNLNVIKNVFDNLMPEEYHLSVIKINTGIVLRLQCKLLAKSL